MRLCNMLPCNILQLLPAIGLLFFLASSCLGEERYATMFGRSNAGLPQYSVEGFPNECACNLTREAIAWYKDTPGVLMPPSAVDHEFLQRFNQLFSTNVTDAGLDLSQLADDQLFWRVGAEQLAMQADEFRLHMKRLFSYRQAERDISSNVQYIGLLSDPDADFSIRACVCNPVSVVSWTGRFSDMLFESGMEDTTSDIFRLTSEIIINKMMNGTVLGSSSDVPYVFISALRSGSVVADVKFVSTKNADEAAAIINEGLEAVANQSSSTFETVSAVAVGNCSIGPPEVRDHRERVWDSSYSHGSRAEYICLRGYRFSSGMSVYYSFCDPETSEFTDIPDSAVCVENINSTTANPEQTLGQTTDEDLASRATGGADNTEGVGGTQETITGVDGNTETTDATDGQGSVNTETTDATGGQGSVNTETTDATGGQGSVNTETTDGNTEQTTSVSNGDPQTSNGEQTDSETTDAVVTTAAPIRPPAITESMVRLKLRFTSMLWDSDYNISATSKAQTKSAEIERMLLEHLQSVAPRVLQVDVVSMYQGSVVAESDITVNDSDITPQRYVEEALYNSTSSGTLGSENIDVESSQVSVVLCANSPPAAPTNGFRVWSGSYALGSTASYYCDPGYTLKTSTGTEIPTPKNIQCVQSGASASFGVFPGGQMCLRDPQSTTGAPTTPQSTPPASTTPGRPMPPTHSTIVTRKVPMFSSLIYSVTVPAAAAILALVFICLCCLRIDSPLCKICADGKV